MSECVYSCTNISLKMADNNVLIFLAMTNEGEKYVLSAYKIQDFGESFDSLHFLSQYLALNMKLIKTQVKILICNLW